MYTKYLGYAGKMEVFMDVYRRLLGGYSSMPIKGKEAYLTNPANQSLNMAV